METASDEPSRADFGGPVRGAARAAHRAHQASRKVPEPSAFFWITKVATTAMGEATSDYMVHRFDPVIAVCFGAAALAISLVLQFSVRRYVPWVYWLAVAMVAVFGTMAADVLHIRFHVPYFASTTLFAIVLALVFVAWQASEKTLSIHSIYTARREVFYWLVVMATFALGTAAGDLSATTLHLGYFWSGVIFLGVIAVPALAYRFFGLNEILAFWFAYVVTRPIGASFADWLDKAHRLGGLGLGNGNVSIGFTLLIVALVIYLSVVHRQSGKMHLAVE